MLSKKINLLKLLIIGLFISIFNTTHATDIGGTISTDTTWTKANSPYIVTSSVSVSNGVTLTIEAGVEIKFNLGTRLTSYGVINAVGTDSEHIVFTSSAASPTNSDWQGLRFRGSGSNESIVDYTEIRYAKGSPDIARTYAGIYLYNSSATISNSLIEDNYDYGVVIKSTTTDYPTLTNNIIQNSDNGIYVRDGSPIITNNDILNNGYYGIYLYTDSDTTEIENNILNGNRYGVYGSGNPNILNNTITNNINNGIYISTSLSFTASGNTVENNQSSGIYTSGAGIPILTNNIVQNNTSYGIQITSTGDSTVTGNTISNNNSYGLYIGNGNGSYSDNIIDGNLSGIYTSNTDATITNNTITNNTEYGINAENLQLRIDGVMDNNTFSGNGIYKFASRGIGIEDTQATIDGTTEDIIIIGTTQLESGKTLTILPGSVIKVSSSGKIYTQGKLLAQGTVDNPIIFTSINDNSVGNIFLGTGVPTNEDWQGLRFRGSGSNESIVDYTEIRYAKGSPDIARTYAGIYLYNSSATISNSLIEDNYDYGVVIKSTTTDYPTLTNNIIQNSDNGIYVRDGSPIITNNDILNNGYYGIYLYTDSDTTEIENNILNGNRYGVYGSGNPNILNNTITNNINNGIYISTSLSFTASGNTVENNQSSGIYTSGAGIPILTNNIVQNNTSYGIQITSTGDSTVTGNTISNNNSYGLYIGNGNGSYSDNIIDGNLSGIYTSNTDATITNNTITNNTEYGINAENLQLRIDGVMDNNTFSGNGIYKYASRGIGIEDTQATIDGTTEDIIIIGTTQLESGKTLTILPGSVIKVSSSGKIYTQGKLLAQGTVDNPIIFTSINDNSVGNIFLGTGVPTNEDWQGLRFRGSGSNESIVDYTEIRYAKGSPDISRTYAGIYLYNSSATISNSLIEDNYDCGIVIKSTTTDYPTLTNNIIQGGVHGIYVRDGSPIITNNDILNNNYYGIYLYTDSDTTEIENNILSGNRYGVYKSGGTPTIQYNLFYNNSSQDTYNFTLDSTNLTGVDPLFKDGTYELSADSPAINMGDPALGNHPISGDRYDIGAIEYSGYKRISYSANITGVNGRNLTYEWQFVNDPSSGVEAPVIDGGVGDINIDRSISCSFTVRKLGNYAIKLQIWDSEELVGSGIGTFIINNE